MSKGFSGGSVVKNLSADAGDMGSVPDLGRSPAQERLSRLATTIEPALSSPGAATTELKQLQLL